MSQQELLTHVVAILRELGIEFMLTGFHASSFQGEPRATHDVDFVVQLDAAAAEQLLAAFDADRFYLSASAVHEALHSGGMFNLLDTTTGEKADFWMLKETPFDQSRFARRERIQRDGQAIDLSSPEDTILMKLLWSKQSGGSEKQFQDVLRVYELQADLLDLAYLQSWASSLGVEESWRRVLDEAEPLILPEN